MARSASRSQFPVRRMVPLFRTPSAVVPSPSMSTLAASTRATSRSARLASITLASTVTSQSSTRLLPHRSPPSRLLPRHLLLSLPLLLRSPLPLLATAKTVVLLPLHPASHARAILASLLSLPLPQPRALLPLLLVLKASMALAALPQHRQPQLLPLPRQSPPQRHTETARFLHLPRLMRLPLCLLPATRAALSPPRASRLRHRHLPLRVPAFLAAMDTDRRLVLLLPLLWPLLLPALVFLPLPQLDIAQVLPLLVPPAPPASQALLHRSPRTQSTLLQATLPRRLATFSPTA